MTDPTPAVNPTDSTPTTPPAEPVIKAGFTWGTLTAFIVSILGVLVALGKISQAQADELNGAVTDLGSYLPGLAASLVGIVGLVSGIASHLATSLVARRQVTPVKKVTR